MRHALVALTALSLLLVPQRGGAVPGDLHLSSISDEGVKARWSVLPSLSADGTRVAFQSSSRLHPADGDDVVDVYVRDLTTGRTILASTSATGEKANGRTSLPAISADGNRVAFASGATNLHPSGSRGLMVKDLLTGEVFLVSAHGEYPVLSADGTRVAFQTTGTGLDPRDDDEASDVYVKDLATGELFLASTSSDGVKANGDFFHGSGGASLSADGRLVGFASGATNLHPGDEDEVIDVYVKDLVSGLISLISTSADGTKADDDSFSPSLSADGDVVAFRSYSSRLVPGFSGGFGQIFVKDLTTDEIVPASLAADGTRADRGAADPSLSADGTRVAFSSTSTNLHPGDGDVVSDIFVKDLATSALELASTSNSGIKSNGISYQVSLSGEAAAVAFRSDATNLDPRDGDSTPDVFVKELGGAAASPLVADLSIRQTDAPDPVPAGENVTYEIRVENAGPSAATGVTLVDELPEGIEFRSATASQGSGCIRSDDLVRCDLGALQPGASAAATVIVAPQGLGYLTNTVTVHGNEPDPRTFDNRSSLNTDVDRAADVALSMTDAPDPASVRSSITYSITVQNLGPTWASLELVDALPDGSRLESVDAGGSRCETSRQEVRCWIFGIPDGGSTTVRVTVSARKPATLTNTATAFPLDFDADASNNTTKESTVVTR